MAQMTREKTELGTDKQQLEGIFERIMPHLLNLWNKEAPNESPFPLGNKTRPSKLAEYFSRYGSTATAKDFEIYATNATFEDPLMRAHGVDQIKSAFYTLPKVFGESRIEEYTVKENVTGPGKVEFIIDNKQHYKVFGKDVDLTTQIRLNVEDGKVVRHEDWAVRGTVVDNGTHLRLPYLFLGFGTIPILWDKKPLKNRDTVNIPFVGRAAEVTRRGSMLLTHAFMRFGKDPKP